MNCLQFKKKKKNHHFISSLVISKVFLMLAVKLMSLQYQIPFSSIYFFLGGGFPSHPLFVVNFILSLVRGCYTPKGHSLLVTIPRIRSISRLLFLSFYSFRIAQRNSSFISYFDNRFPRSIFMLNLHKKLDCSATQTLPCVITAS